MQRSNDIIFAPADLAETTVPQRVLRRRAFLFEAVAHPGAKNRLAWLGANPLRKLCGISESHIFDWRDEFGICY
jgi:hypothetical protein